MIVVPKRHGLTVTAPGSNHAVRVTNTLGGSVANTDVGEDMVFNIEAIASNVQSCNLGAEVTLYISQ